MVGRIDPMDFVFCGAILLALYATIASYKNPYFLEGDRNYVVNRVKHIGDKNKDDMISAEEWRDIYGQIGVPFNIEDDET